MKPTVLINNTHDYKNLNKDSNIKQKRLTEVKDKEMGKETIE